MGNCFSGRWRHHRKKQLVEDSLYVDVRELSENYISVAAGMSGVPVRTHAGRTVCQPEGRMLPLNDGGLAFAFPFEIDDGPVWQGIPLLTSVEPRVRRETFFGCPGDGCGSRSRKLYLPPGRLYFLCRQCHDLAYRSQQDHDPRVSSLCRDPDRLIRVLQRVDVNRDRFSTICLLLRAGWQAVREIDKALPDYTPLEQLAAGLLDEENLNRMGDV